MKKRLVCTLFTAAMLTVSLAGCGGNGSDDASSSSDESSKTEDAAEAEESDETEDESADSDSQRFDETVTLSFMTWSYNDRGPSTDAWIDACLEKYNIEIEMQNVTTNEYAAAFKAKASAGELPDLVHIHGLTPDYYVLTEGVTVDENTFVDISDLEALQNYSEDTINAMKVNDKLYYMPVTQNTLGVIYNKAVFEENNITIPTNFDEFVAAMDALKAAGVAPLAGSFADAWSSQIISLIAFDNYVWRADNDIATKLYDANTKTSSLKWSEVGDDVDKALGLINSWVEAGYFTDDPGGTDANTASQLLATGQAAMFITGNWQYSAVSSFTDDPTNIGFFALPLNEEGEDPVMSVSISEGICINANSENVEAAKLAMELYLSPEIQALVCGDMGAPSTNQAVESSDHYIQEIVAELDNSIICTEGWYSTSYVGHMMPSGASFATADELTNLALGYISPEEFCTKADEAIAEFMAEN